MMTQEDTNQTVATEPTPVEPVQTAPEPFEPATPPQPAASTAPSGKGAASGSGTRPFGQQNGRFGGRPGGGRGGARGGGRPGDRRRSDRGGEGQAEVEYEEKNIEVARVTRVTKGGKRMRFRALSVIGNRKGRTGFGLAKGVDVALATSKATTQARKALITVPLVNQTIPHAVEAKFGASHVLLKPAPQGTGIKAGGAVRIVLSLAGIPNVVSKILGSSNKVNNVKATFAALKKLQVKSKQEHADAVPASAE